MKLYMTWEEFRNLLHLGDGFRIDGGPIITSYEENNDEITFKWTDCDGQLFEDTVTKDIVEAGVEADASTGDLRYTNTDGNRTELTILSIQPLDFSLDFSRARWEDMQKEPTDE